MPVTPDTLSEPTPPTFRPDPSPAEDADAPPTTHPDSRGLTERQEAFCRHYVLYPVAGEAARRAGYAKSGAYVEGHRLLRNAKIRQRIWELRGELCDEALVSPMTQIAKLEQIIERATAQWQFHAAVRAVHLQARLAGLLRPGPARKDDPLREPPSDHVYDPLGDAARTHTTQAMEAQESQAQPAPADDAPGSDDSAPSRSVDPRVKPEGDGQDGGKASVSLAINECTEGANHHTLSCSGLTRLRDEASGAAKARASVSKPAPGPTMEPQGRDPWGQHPRDKPESDRKTERRRHCDTAEALGPPPSCTVRVIASACPPARVRAGTQRRGNRT